MLTRFHVDDLLFSHVDSMVNDKFAKRLNKIYGKHGKEVKCVRGNHHYLEGIGFEFNRYDRAFATELSEENSILLASMSTIYYLAMLIVGSIISLPSG